MKIIFCDTNVVFGLFQRFAIGQPLTNSMLIQLAKKHEVYISEFVFIELQKNYLVDYGVEIAGSQYQLFLDTIGFHAVISIDPQADLAWMVSDSQDLQILQDAYSVKADFLITKNTKDFNVEAVSQYLHIAIVPSIPGELLLDL